MDALSLTFILFVLFLFSFFLASSESALAAAKNNRLAKREHAQTNLFSNGQAIHSLAFVASLLNTSFIAICIMMLEQVISVYFMLFTCFLLAFIVLFCVLIPKILASKYLEPRMMRFAKPSLLILWLASPLRTVSEFLSEKAINNLIPKNLEPDEATSEEEFAELIDLAYQQGVIERSELEKYLMK